MSARSNNRMHDSSGINIRRALPDEAKSLAELGTETFCDSFDGLYSEENLRRFLAANHSEAAFRKMLDDSRLNILVLDVPEMPYAGYAIWGPCGLPVKNLPDNAGEMKRIYLRKPVQGRAYGSALFEFVLSQLEAVFDHIYVGVWSENIGAQRFYARYGFNKVGEYDFMVGDHADLEWILCRQANPVKAGRTRG